MRLFVAAELPEAERRRLSELGRSREIFGDEVGSLSWVRPENLHVTLKFLGEVADNAVPRVCDALRQVPTSGPIRLHVEGLTFFPPRGPVRVFVAELGGEVDRLTSLQASIEDAVEPLGFRREARAFRPHATLARAGRERRLKRNVRESARTHSIPKGAPFTVDSFVLVRSHLKPTGAEYVVIARFPLAELQ